jgi:hypothetical protein
MATAHSISLGPSQLLAQGVSLIFGFDLHYFLVPSEHSFAKELSQILAPIPGGPHATNFDWTLLPRFHSDCDEIWASTTG